MKNLEQLNWSEYELAELKNRIMQKVHFIWFLRKVLLPASLVLAVSGFILFQQISQLNLGIILNNIWERVAKLEIIGLANYFLVAVSKTELDSLLIMVSSTLLAAFFGRKLIREMLSFWLRSSSKMTFSWRDIRR